MMWAIPAKTFLVGEYAAIARAPAIVLTTAPCFALSIEEHPGLVGIHPSSPAGQWWNQYGPRGVGLKFTDPYHGIGGVGASSAEFVGVYLAQSYLNKQLPDANLLLEAYQDFSYDGQGARPSGYDVLAQMLGGVVYIDKQHSICQKMFWPFCDVDFLLIHSGQKLATHCHLQSLVLPQKMEPLIDIVQQTKAAFDRTDSRMLANAVNAYHQELLSLAKVSDHSQKLIEYLRQQDDILAIKGCGAMGADVLLMLVSKSKALVWQNKLAELGLRLLATTEGLYGASPAFSSNIS
jgi:mevalonate kinase